MKCPQCNSPMDLNENIYWCLCPDYPNDNIVSYQVFGSRIQQYCRGNIKHYYPRKGDKRQTIWVGIKINKEWFKVDDDDDNQKKIA